MLGEGVVSRVFGLEYNGVGVRVLVAFIAGGVLFRIFRSFGIVVGVGRRVA